MFETLILSAALVIQPNIVNSLQETPDTEYVHVCVLPAPPLMFVLASDHPIEMDEEGNYVIREGENPEGVSIETLTLRGPDWHCSSTTFAETTFP